VRRGSTTATGHGFDLVCVFVNNSRSGGITGPAWRNTGIVKRMKKEFNARFAAAVNEEEVDTLAI